MAAKSKIQAGLGGALLLAAVLLHFCSSSGTISPQDRRSAHESVTRPVPTAVVVECPRQITREFPGKVRANRRVELAFDLDGLLVELNAREGSLVTKGSVLARLDSRDGQNALNAAQAHFDDLSRTLDRSKKLRKKRLIAESEYDKALAAWEIAKADLRIREKALSDTIIVAPFDGLVAERGVENYQRVEAGQTFLSFQDISSVEVVIQVPERLIARGGIEALHDLKVHFDTDGGSWLGATAHEYRAQPDAATRTYDVIVSLAPPADIKILPGMTATVKATIDNVALGALDPLPSDPTQVPPEAIWTNGKGETFGWIIPAKGGSPQRARVEISPLQNGQVVVLSGLNPGQQVAVAGLHALREGIRVRPRAPGKEGQGPRRERPASPWLRGAFHQRRFR